MYNNLLDNIVPNTVISSIKVISFNTADYCIFDYAF